jgi:DNA-binding NarL/FixJ family response regulator
MNSRYRHRVLIVEDDSRWAGLMATCAKRYEDEIDFQFVKAYDQAIGIMSWTRFHLVSIDQNIAMSEGGLVSPDNGFELCEWLARWQPLVERRFYTANGEKEFIYRASRGSHTDYFEKKTEDDQKNAFDIPEYLANISSHLKGDHLQWFLRKAKRHLPPVLATPAAILGVKMRDQELPLAFEQANGVWQHTLWMAWAQACALAARAGEFDTLRSMTVSNKAVYAEQSLRALFPKLLQKGHLAAWYKFISGDVGPENAGRPFLGGLESFRHLRNPIAHLRNQIGHLDMEKVKPDMFTILDGAAFWSEYPLLVQPHFHPYKPGIVVATRISGAKPWFNLEFPFQAQIPNPELRNHVFVPYYVVVNFTKFEEIFLDLYPLIMMEDLYGKHPQPVLTTPSGKNGCERISLEDGTTCDLPLSPAAREAITTMFGRTWTPR